MHFLTGSTGFLGRQLLGRLIVNNPDREVNLLIRPNNSGNAEQRKEALVKGLFEDSDLDLKKINKRIHAYSGDLSVENFGLSQKDYSRLTDSSTEITHCAASTNLGQAYDNAYKENFLGTQHIIDLCKNVRSSNNLKLHFISTAYVAGDIQRVITPEELDLNAPFKNAYEKTKAQAESLVRQHKDEFNCVIYRPSIVVGDSITGETSAFNVLYPAVKLFLRGLFIGVPATPQVPFDIVPVDYVADTIVEIMSLDLESGSCFHVTSGVGRESSPQELIELSVLVAQKFSQKHLHIPGFISQELLNKACSRLAQAREFIKILEKKVTKRMSLFDQILPFIPYMVRNPQFDTSSTHNILPNNRGLAPLFSSYSDEIFSYCLETNWGKIPWSNPRNRNLWFSRS